MLASFCPTIFSNHIVDVTSLNAHAEVTRIAAFPVIAGMHNHEIIGDERTEKFESHTVRISHPAFVPVLTISVRN